MDMPSWLRPNYTEPRVLVAVRDLCLPSATAYDVGANFGGITIGMSRAVGPKGAICSFEANPKIAKRCQETVVEAGCGNVQIYHGAVYHRSGETIDLYISANQVADSIHYRVSDEAIKVPTLALDDFASRTRLIPSFVKMDIEGAEHDALLGFEATISASRPIIILEQAPSEVRCLALLQKHGYMAVDLSTYDVVETMADLPPETVVTDILFAAPEVLTSRGYVSGKTRVAELTTSDFDWSDGLIIKSKPLSLGRGRYIVRAKYVSDKSDVKELMCGMWRVGEEEPMMQHHGHSDSLSELAHRWVFETGSCEIQVFFRFVHERAESFTVESVEILRVDGLADRTALWA